jgi:hypothetical protein
MSHPQHEHNAFFMIYLIIINWKIYQMN